MNEKNIPISCRTKLIHVDNEPRGSNELVWYNKKYLRKKKREAKQIGTQSRRSKEKQELQTLNEQEENL